MADNLGRKFLVLGWIDVEHAAAEHSDRAAAGGDRTAMGCGRTTRCGRPSRVWRKGNVGKQRDAATGGHASDDHATGGCGDANQKPRSHDTSRIAWAKLMARVGEKFPLECPACGGDIRLISLHQSRGRFGRS